MHRKPWPIIVLTALFALIPISNLLTTYFLISDQTTFSNYLYSLITIKSNYIKVFNLIAPPILATYAIYVVKKWSYLLLVVSILWIYGNAFKNIGLELTTIQVIFSIVSPVLFGLFVLVYFASPNVRKTYFDPSLKWWEAKPRFIVSLEAILNNDSQNFNGNILNISEGGVLIDIPSEAGVFVKDDKLNLEFKVEGYEFNTKAKVIFKNPNNDQYGLQFADFNETYQTQIKDAIKTLRDNNTQMSREPIPWKSDFISWFEKLRKTGKGLTPEIPKNGRKS